MFIEHKQIFRWRRSVRNRRETALCRRLVAGGLLFAASAAPVAAAPTGGTVTSGSADISLGTDTVIDQTSNRVDINWTGFDTNAAESVTFNQPGSDALAINRISGNRTAFDGTLTANGRIFLINRNGITFGATAQVNTGALLATTSELVDSPAPQTYTFSGDGYASVVNNGAITVSDGGFAVLAAPNVENNGYIKVDLGQIELASTSDYTVRVDLRGDDLITFQAPGEWLEGEEGPPGVTSTGTLQARSGQVYLSANMASELVSAAVNLSGVVDADQFTSTPDGGLAIVASAEEPGYAGGTIKVESTGDINIGAGADIHAVGGETVTAAFLADRDIKMGAADEPARITLQAASTDDAADASAGLEMVAAVNGGPGTLNIDGADIAVGAQAAAADGSGTAAASVVLEGAQVEIDADFAVQAQAQGADADALAVLDVFANGEIEYDTSGNVITYGAPGDLVMRGDIDVGATAAGSDPGSGRATANTVLAATGSTQVTAPVDVNADAGGGTADANAALAMLGGTPPALPGLLRDVSLNRAPQLGTLSDILTLASLDDVLGVFGGLLQDPAGFIALLGGIGDGGVSYTGDSNVNALATAGSSGVDGAAAEATAAGYFVAGGDVYINTDPVKVDARAFADQAGGEAAATEARGFLVAAAGLAGIFGAAPEDGLDSELTVLGDLSASAREQATRNGEPDPAAEDQLAAAVTALLATGDITVRGADPLAAADPAVVQGRSSQWQVCYQDQCLPLSPGSDGVLGLAEASAGGDPIASAHLAQIIIESLYGAIDIQPKGTVTQVQPAGLFTDPIGPIWPGDLPLRFDPAGRMLVATGVDATRPPQIVALDGGIEAAILAGGDPSTLLPATASGGCVAAGRDAFTISGPDYFDRMISANCEEGE